MSALVRRIALGPTMFLALVGGACTAAASSSTPGSPAHKRHGQGSQSTPPRDRFQAVIVSGTGAYAGDTGRVQILLRPHGSGSSRHVAVRFRGSPCGGAAHCLDLRGRLAGKLTRSGHQVPDTGSHYTLTATGTLTQVGDVRAKGWVQGTGFIAHAQERMRITLTSSSGTVTLRGHSPEVKGFTSP